jgi:hypothetical protein
MTKDGPDGGAHPGYPGVAIVAGGAMVAWFQDAEVAAEWATENHFGNWLMHPCVLPHVPPFSKEHLALARERAEELYVLMGEPRTLEN